jgi:tRNA G18 (ribose-2'-O)-methylase SpoU
MIMGVQARSFLPIDSLDDPRVAPYRNMKDKELARDGGRFIAEGELVVRRLLAARFGVESLLISRRKADAILPVVPAGVPVWVADDETIRGVIGFEFHSGVLAVGVRPAGVTLDSALPKDKPELTLVVCPKVTNLENMGSIVRIAAAFGADAMLLGEQCCDPFFRQSVRVSMGAVFKLPIVPSRDIVHDLHRLKSDWQMERIATVLDDTAEPLATARRSRRVAIVFGSEADGLSPAQIAACDRRVTIPMKLGTDSLNIAVAAGIFMHHFTSVAATG